MTRQDPSRKPLDDDALFKTLRGLHPSEAQLRDISIVEKDTLDRLKLTGKVTSNLASGRSAAKKNAGASLRRR